MNVGFEKRLLVVWLVLSAATLVSLWMGSFQGRDALAPSAAVTTSAIAVALIKVRIIFREFMEVRHAPALLGRLTDLWILVTGVSLLGSYFAGRALSMG